VLTRDKNRESETALRAVTPHLTTVDIDNEYVRNRPKPSLYRPNNSFVGAESLRYVHTVPMNCEIGLYGSIQ